MERAYACRSEWKREKTESYLWVSGMGVSVHDRIVKQMENIIFLFSYGTLCYEDCRALKYSKRCNAAIPCLITCLRDDEAFVRGKLHRRGYAVGPDVIQS